MAEAWIGQYEALVTAGGVVTLKDWSQVVLTGNDRVKFLQNMCTNDIRPLEPGRSCEAFCTDVKGKILSHVLVVPQEDRLVLLTVPGQGERLIKHLDRYIIREDVQLTDASDAFDWHLALGPGARAQLELSSTPVKCDALWPEAWLVTTARSESSLLAGLTAVDTSSPAWAALRTESFLPLYGVDFDDSHLPQEINRDAQAISFTKGCYLGQETVARIDALGHVNKKLVLVSFAGEQVPSVGTPLSDGGQNVGTVTTAAWSPRFRAPLAIAMVRRGANDMRSQLSSDYGSAEVIPPADRVT